MRVIGMLLGIPEQDQEAIRDRADADLRTEAGAADEVLAGPVRDRRGLRRVHRLAGRAPLRRPDDRAAARRVRGRDRHDPSAHPRRGAHLRQRRRRGRQRDDDPADRLDRQGARRPPRPAPGARRGPVADPERDRGAPPLRAAGARTSPGTSPATSSTTARRCRRAASWCSSSARPTATTAASPTATASTSTATSASTSPSATASTSASAPRWPASKGAIALDEVLQRFPEWEVDRDNARLSPTSTVRGWETLPVVDRRDRTLRDPRRRLGTRRPAHPPGADPLPGPDRRHRLGVRDPGRLPARAGRVLARHVRLAGAGSAAQRARALPHRDRRPVDPLHPRRARLTRTPSRCSSRTAGRARSWSSSTSSRG